MAEEQKTGVAELERLLPLAAEPGWLPVGLFLLQGEYQAPCDLYLRPAPGRYVLFARKGLICDEVFRNNLAAIAAKCLYVRDEDTDHYFGYVKKVLNHLVASPYVDSVHKAGAVYSSCQEIMRRVFTEPRAVFLHFAQEIIGSTVDLVIADGVATRCLARLTAYDRSTYTHSTNVGIFGIALARNYYGCSAEHDLREMGGGFFLHDIGKTAIPLEILNKPGPLTAEERRIVNRHPRDGYNLLCEQGVMTDTMQLLTLQHHEKDDGSGYPNGLTETDIHPYARICRLVDVYEALTSDRPYHQRRSTFEALKLMKEKVVTDIDQQLFEHFLRLFLA